MGAIAKLTADLEMNNAGYRQSVDAAKKKTKTFKKEVEKTDKKMGFFTKSMRGASQGLNAMSGPLNGVSGRLSGVNSLLSSGAIGFAAMGAAIAGVTLMASASVREFSKMEQQQLKTEAIINSTGSAAGRTADQLEKQAKAVALATLASTDGIMQAQHILLTFTSVQTEVFDRAIKISQDMAATMGGTAKSQAMALGKALEVPTKGITKLTKVGVNFTAKEVEKIKIMEQSGRVAEAQGLILDKLAGQMGGAGEAEAKGVAGAADTAGQAYSEMLVTFSKTTGSAEGAITTLETMTTILKGFDKWLDPGPMIRHNELAVRRIEIQDNINRIEKMGAMGRFVSQKNLNEMRQEEISVVKEMRALMLVKEKEDRARNDALIASESKTLQAKVQAAEDAEKIAFEKEEKKALKVEEKRIVDNERFEGALLKKVEKLELSNLTEEQKIATSYARRNLMVLNAQKRGLIDDARVKRLTLNNEIKLEKDITAIRKKKSLEDNAAQFADWRGKLKLFGAGQQALQSISELGSGKLAKISQKLALFQAGAALPAAVIEAFKNGGGLPWGAIPAAMTLAAGLKQIQSIKSQSMGGTSSPPPISAPSFDPIASLPDPDYQAIVPAEAVQDAVSETQEVGESLITKIVNISVEDDELYSGKAMRKLIESINDVVGNNVLIKVSV